MPGAGRRTGRKIIQSRLFVGRVNDDRNIAASKGLDQRFRERTAWIDITGRQKIAVRQLPDFIQHMQRPLERYGLVGTRCLVQRDRRVRRLEIHIGGGRTKFFEQIAEIRGDKRLSGGCGVANDGLLRREWKIGRDGGNGFDPHRLQFIRLGLPQSGKTNNPVCWLIGRALIPEFAAEGRRAL